MSLLKLPDDVKGIIINYLTTNEILSLMKQFFVNKTDLIGLNIMINFFIAARSSVINSEFLIRLARKFPFKQYDSKVRSTVLALLSHSKNCINLSHTSMSLAGNTVMHVIAQHGHLEMLKDLMEFDNSTLEINKRHRISKNTPLMEALSASNLDVAFYLIKQGVDTSLVNAAGDSALTLAINANHIELVRLILSTCTKESKESNEKPNRSMFQRNPLIMAARNGYSDILAEILISSTIPVDSYDSFKNTALIYACEKNHKECVEHLLHYGANLNHVGNQGFTGLMWAAVNGHLAIVELLVSHGANTQLTSARGEVAADYSQNDLIRNVLMNAHTNETRDMSAFKSSVADLPSPPSIHDSRRGRQNPRAVTYSLFSNKYAKPWQKVKSQQTRGTTGTAS
jgi:hypothetical protein